MFLKLFEPVLLTNTKVRLVFLNLRSKSARYAKLSLTELRRTKQPYVMQMQAGGKMLHICSHLIFMNPGTDHVIAYQFTHTMCGQL